MLQSMRDGAQSTAIKVLVFLIVLSFAGFGLESILPGGSGTSIAEVNGTEISPQEVQLAIERQKRQMLQIFGDDIDPAMLEDDRLRPAALEGLIERELLLQDARDLGLVASDKAIGRIVAGIDAFKVEGQFSPEQYKVVLANAGLTPERFRRSQAQDIALTQLQDGVMLTDFVTAIELSAAADIVAEERDVRYLLVSAESLDNEASISEEAIRTYYEQHPDEFQSEQQIVAQYVEISPDDFLAPVDEQLVRDQFEVVKDEYSVSNQARVAHILLIQRDDESDEDYALRIDDVASRLDAGEDFATIAAETSDDIGSASEGGELGFTDGSAFPDAMEAAIASLDVGATSGPVETDAGTHFIRVQERVAGEIPDYEALRAELEESIQRAEAEQALLSAVDVLRDLSFNAPDLSGPAEAIGVEAQVSAPIGRSGGSGSFGLPKVVDALFSDDVVVAGNNSEVMELAGNRFIVLRAQTIIPPSQIPLETVADQIQARLEQQAREDYLAQLVDDIRQRRAAGETLEAIAKEAGWEWRVELGARRSGSLLPPEVAAKAFEMEPGEGVSIDLATLPAGQFAIVELDKVKPGSLDNLSTSEQAALQSELATRQQQTALLSYRQALRNNAEIVTR